MTIQSTRRQTPALLREKQRQWQPAPTLCIRVTIKEKRDHKKPDHGMVVEALEVFNQRGETMLACELLLLVKRGGT
jgi:acyl dehydratase